MLMMKIIKNNMTKIYKPISIINLTLKNFLLMIIKMIEPI